LIADAIGEDDLRKSASEQLAPYFSPWLDGTNADALLYDTEWGAVSALLYAFDTHRCVILMAVCMCQRRARAVRLSFSSSNNLHHCSDAVLVRDATSSARCALQYK
jgi:hypothetical protein